MTTLIRPRPGGFARPTAGLWPLRLPAHRASSAILAGAYPFLAPAPPALGTHVGVDALTGEPFAFDPWALYAAGELTNPNMLLAGVIGQGKSALAKSLVLRSVAAGRKAYIPGDPKGEWSAVADAVGGTVIRLAPGGNVRLNPLDGHADRPGTRAAVLVAITETLLSRPLRPAEHAALDAAVGTTARTWTGPTLTGVVEALTHPDEAGARSDWTTPARRADDGRDLAHALRRLTRGDLSGLFDGPSTHRLDAASPMVVLDLSALGSDDTALDIAMTCASAWLETALTAGAATTEAGGPRWVVYDEAWRLLRSAPLLHRMQAQWKLSRAYGIANLLVLHRLSDLDAIGATGTATRALAEGLLADCSTRVIYRQETDQLPATARALGLTRPEREVLPLLPRGTGLWKLPGRSHLVHHRLHVDELPIIDTDAAMDPARHGSPS